MRNKDVSIMITAKDNYSQAIASMKSTNASFEKDLDGLSQKLNKLNNNKISLKIDLDKAKTALKDAQKQFAKTGEAADEMNYKMVQQDFEQVRRNYDLVSKSAKQTEKDILGVTDAISKADNRASKSGSGGSSSSGAGGLLATLGAAGVTQFIGNAVSEMASAYVGSAFGNEGSTIFGSALSSAASGASIGTMIAPGIGTAIGGALGLAIGTALGGVQVYKNQDEAFKSVIQSRYDSAKQSQADSLASGTQIAATREQNLISFGTLLGGDENAKQFLSDMTEFAAHTPFEYDQLASISRTLLAYGYEQNQILPMLEKIGDAGSALGMSGEDMTYVATALGRMTNSGKTTMEYLNPLLERGIPVWEYLSEASGKSQEKVQEMVSKGLVPGAEAAKAIADYMGGNFAGNMEKQAGTYQGLASTLADAEAELNNAIGAGYNEKRKEGLLEQADWLSGENGMAMRESYAMIGEWEAHLENEQERMQRESFEKMMQSTEYQMALATDDRVEMGRLMAKARIDAENEYNASEGYQSQVESDKLLLEKVRNDTSLRDNYWNTGYVMQQEFSKGRLANMRDSYTELSQAQIELNDKLLAEEEAHARNRGAGLPAGGYSAPSEGNTNAIDNALYNLNPTGHATGIFRVPYNNFPALLHEGETVSTAVEARSKQNAAPNVIITGNEFIVRSDDDISAIASELVAQLYSASLVTP